MGRLKFAAHLEIILMVDQKPLGPIRVSRSKFKHPVLLQVFHRVASRPRKKARLLLIYFYKLITPTFYAHEVHLKAFRRRYGVYPDLTNTT